jgi:hypothetical protein
LSGLAHLHDGPGDAVVDEVDDDCDDLGRREPYGA